jgi:cobalt-zinc-cadmium efflux system membrane fusion protein
MKKIIYLALSLAIVSCSSKQTEEIRTDNVTQENSKGKITLTIEQIEVAQIKTGKATKQKISETLQCTGSVEIPPENIATISPSISGFVKDLKYLEGDWVSKGDILATLEHPEFIKLQQQYLEAKSQIEYFQEEYKRQGELTVENAASIKKMQKAKADFLASEATYKSLKSQLELLGVNTSEIEKGDFVKEYKLITPISGVVSKLNTNKGKQVSPEDFVYEIANDKTLYLHFRVFEKDISRVKVGQKIMFGPLNQDTKYEAKVQRIGITIDNADRSTLVHSKIENVNKLLKPGMFLNASIYLNEQESYTISEEAVVEYEGEYFVFIQNKNSFELIKIERGAKQDGFVELITPTENLIKSDIVINGNYYLQSILQAEG